MKQLKSKPTDAELLQLYSLYKQSTEGDINRGVHVPSVLSVLCITDKGPVCV